jgi:hypothetical protein
VSAQSDNPPARFVLDFDIPADVYKKAITRPLAARKQPQGVLLAMRIVLAIALMSLSIICFSYAFFDIDGLAPMCFGFTLGSGVTLAAWWKQHRTLVTYHLNTNANAGRHHYEIDATGIVAARDHIKSEIGWPFVNAINSVEEATLIEVQTARLIVPDLALDVSPDVFRAQLETWRTA